MKFSDYNIIQKVSFVVGVIVMTALMLGLAALLVGLLWRAVIAVWS